MPKGEYVDNGQAGQPYAARNIKNNEVDLPSPALADMLPDIYQVATLIGGTRAMQAAGTDYLPQHEYESDKAYDRRLSSAVLDNFTLRTLDSLTGKAFKTPPKLREETASEVITEFLKDVDDAGTGLTSFAREWFRLGIEQAVSYVLVDQPALMPREDGSPRTKADDERDGTRPFWRIITAEDMLDYREGKVQVDGKMKVRPTYIRFRDDRVEEDGPFNVKLVQRRKIIRHEDSSVIWEAWELIKGPRGGKKEWRKVDEGSYGLSLIPVVAFYTNKSGPGEGRSPLVDLSDLNKRHWQSTADQNNALTTSRFPILAASGVRDAEGEGDGGQIVVGPNKFITTPDPQSKVYYVESTGAALERGESDLDRLEKAMSNYGSQFMQKGAQGPETASGRILDNAEATSPLESWGIDFKDALETAGWLTLMWMGDAEGEMLFDFEIDANAELKSEDMTTLDNARARKDISRKAWVAEAQRRGILSEEYDADLDEEEIEAEPELGGGLGGMFKDEPPSKDNPPED